MKILNKNGLPYSIRVLFAPGVVILPIKLDLSDFFEFRYSLHKERTVLVWFIERAWAACDYIDCKYFAGKPVATKKFGLCFAAKEKFY